MAFADPQKVKVTAKEETLPRVSVGSFSSEYTSSDGLITLKLSTANGRRKRHVARIDLSKITEDPFDDTKNVQVSTSAYLVVDKPLAGFTAAELKTLVEGLIGFLSASSYSATDKLLGSES
jgi:hypothetical protein